MALTTTRKIESLDRFKATFRCAGSRITLPTRDSRRASVGLAATAAEGQLPELLGRA
jgi:hypothetical protein